MSHPILYDRGDLSWWFSNATALRNLVVKLSWSLFVFGTYRTFSLSPDLLTVAVLHELLCDGYKP
jgi:hypothetical protein